MACVRVCVSGGVKAAPARACVCVCRVSVRAGQQLRVPKGHSYRAARGGAEIRRVCSFRVLEPQGSFAPVRLRGCGLAPYAQRAGGLRSGSGGGQRWRVGAWQRHAGACVVVRGVPVGKAKPGARVLWCSALLGRADPALGSELRRFTSPPSPNRVRFRGLVPMRIPPLPVCHPVRDTHAATSTPLSTHAGSVYPVPKSKEEGCATWVWWVRPSRQTRWVGKAHGIREELHRDDGVPGAQRRRRCCRRGR